MKSFVIVGGILGGGLFGAVIGAIALANTNILLPGLGLIIAGSLIGAIFGAFVGATLGGLGGFFINRILSPKYK